MAVPLVLFSGGLDSTYLLQQLLKQSCVETLYVHGGQASAKVKMELLHRQRIIDFFNANLPFKVTGQYERLKAMSLTSNRSAWSQPAAWILGALAVIDPDRHSALHIGYVSDDGAYFGSHLKHIERAWYELQKISIVGDPVPLKFDLLPMRKVNILRDLDKRVLNNIWVCEIPKEEKPCGACKACKLAKQVLAEYQEEYGETVHTTRLKALNRLTKLHAQAEEPISPETINHDYYTYHIAGKSYFVDASN